MTNACTYGYTGLSDRDLKIATLVLLCDGGSGGGLTCGDYSGGTPDFTPSSGCGLAFDTSNDSLWAYRSGAWVELIAGL
jgi:hypothetical protein